MATLAYSIHFLRDPVTGERRSFAAGAELPPEYEDQITETARDYLFGEPAREPVTVQQRGVRVDAQGNEIQPNRVRDEALPSPPPTPTPTGTGPSTGDDTPDIERPAKSASKADWVDFAVAQGADRDEAEATTKDDLVDRYGD